MIDTGVYIPPHLRNRGGDERDRRDYSRDNYSAQRNDSRSGSHYNSSGPSGGGYETNSRWKLGNDSGGRSGGGWGSGGYGGGSGYGGGYGGGSSYGSGGGYGYGPRPNSLGFFGDERPNRRLENELFHSGEGQSAGINFDKVCAISYFLISVSMTIFLLKLAMDVLNTLMSFLSNLLGRRCIEMLYYLVT